MKIVLTIIVTLAIVALLLYILNKQKQAAQKLVLSQNVNVNQQQPSTGALAQAGMSLANLIANTKCGKNGNPPCTKEDLQQAGWSQEQISQAEAGSTALSNWSLCYNLGIGC